MQINIQLGTNTFYSVPYWYILPHWDYMVPYSNTPLSIIILVWSPEPVVCLGLDRVCWNSGCKQSITSPTHLRIKRNSFIDDSPVRKWHTLFSRYHFSDLWTKQSVNGSVITARIIPTLLRLHLVARESFSGVFRLLHMHLLFLAGIRGSQMRALWSFQKEIWLRYALLNWWQLTVYFLSLLSAGTTLKAGWLHTWKVLGFTE